MGKVMVLSFSDEEEYIYQRMMQIISNSKNFEWCNMLQETNNIHIGELTVDLSKRSVVMGNTEVMLTNREFEILYLLATYISIPCALQEQLQRVLGFFYAC